MSFVKPVGVALCFLASVPFALAQGLGAKKDLTATAPASSGPIVQPMDLLQMVVALCIVAALVKWVLPKVISKLGKRITTPLGSTIKLEESATFGGGQLQIVSVRGKTLLLCVATSGVSCLADLTDSDAERAAESPVFFDVLDNADPTRAVVSVDPEEQVEDQMSMDEAISLISATQSRILGHPTNEGPLDRLNRLTGS